MKPNIPIILFFALFVLSFLITAGGITGYAVRQVYSCTDSDNGNNQFVKGYVSFRNPQLTRIYQDTCMSVSRLREYSCKGVNLSVTIHECSCRDSRCQNCVANAKAACYKSNLYWYDSCGNKGAVKSYCENGCEKNACLPKKTLTATNIKQAASIKPTIKQNVSLSAHY
jgi:hypothetical protein